LALLFLFTLPTRIPKLLHRNIGSPTLIIGDWLGFMHFLLDMRYLFLHISKHATFTRGPVGITINLIRQVADYLNFGLVKAFRIGELVLNLKIIERILRR